MNLFWRSAVMLKIALLSVLLIRKNEQLPTTQPSVSFFDAGDQVLPLDPAQTQGFEKLEYLELNANVLRENKIIYKPQLVQIRF